MEVAVRSRGLPADRVIEIKGGISNRELKESVSGMRSGGI